MGGKNRRGSAANNGLPRGQKYSRKRVSSRREVDGRRTPVRDSARQEELPKSIPLYPVKMDRFMIRDNIFVCARSIHDSRAHGNAKVHRNFMQTSCCIFESRSSPPPFFGEWFMVPLILLFKATYRGYHRRMGGELKSIAPRMDRN